MAALIPNAQLVLLEGGGHMLMLEKAEEVSALIAGFTRQLG
jgi:pimeloyl-ACP methyl ester carboxylesterase